MQIVEQDFDPSIDCAPIHGNILEDEWCTLIHNSICVINKLLLDSAGGVTLIEMFSRYLIFVSFQATIYARTGRR